MIINIYNSLKKAIPLKIKISIKTLAYDILFYRNAMIIYHVKNLLNKIKMKKNLNIQIKRKGKINILLLLPHLVYGGVETLTYNFIKGINKRKYKIFIACTLKRGALYDKFQKLNNGNIYDLSRISNNLWRQKSSLIKIIEEKKIDIVHISNNEPYYFITPFLFFLLPRPKIINWLHCDVTYFKAHEIGYKKFLPFIDKTIIINKQMKTFLTRIKKIPPHKISLISNGVDVNTFNPNRFNKNIVKKYYRLPLDKKIIAFIGRLASEKLPLEFIQIAKNILDIQNNVLFLVIGDGYYKDAMTKLTNKMGINNHMLFLGNVSNMPRIISCVDILISTSISEGFGLAIAEAMAMEIPVVAYKVGGISELIKNGKNGFLIDTLSKDKFVNSVLLLLNSKKIRTNMGTCGRKTIIEDYNINKTTKKICQLYEDLVI
jgi:O-antigen biosynthesis protein